MSELQGFPALELSAGDLRAAFLPNQGMLCASLQHRGVELLRRNENLKASAASGSTAGIPLLYPWANRLTALNFSLAGKNVALDNSSPWLHFDANGLPNHGIPWAQLPWTVQETNANSVRAQLDWIRPEWLAIFPFRHHLQLKATLTPQSLLFDICVLANCADPVPVSFGFHPYFGLPGLPRSEWRVKSPAMQKLELDARGIPTGAESPLSASDTTLGQLNLDDEFRLETDTAAFELSGGSYAIRVEFLQGYRYAQLFAPKDKSFIAIEPMTAPANALVSSDALHIVPAGGEYRASFRVSVHYTN